MHIGKNAIDTLLILLGVLGFGAIIISVHVFSVDSEDYEGGANLQAAGESVRGRSGGDRRSELMVLFPLEVDGDVVSEDRRSPPDRRQAAA